MINNNTHYDFVHYPHRTLIEQFVVLANPFHIRILSILCDVLIPNLMSWKIPFSTEKYP